MKRIIPFLILTTLLVFSFDQNSYAYYNLGAFWRASSGSSGSSISAEPYSNDDGTASGQAQATAIAVDSSGNVYVTGDTGGAGLDGNTLKGTFDLIITKYNSAGVRQWTVEDGATGGTTVAQAIAVDSSGNVYVTGYTTGAGLDGNTLVGSEDLIITKYNTSGTRQWTVEDGTASASIYGTGIAVDSSSNVYVSGYTSGAGLDSNTLKGTTDLIVTKYNTSGARQWTVEDGTSGASTSANGLALDSSTNVYIAGSTSGAGIDGNTLKGTQDLFITKYNSSGTRQWTSEDGATGAKVDGTGVAVDSSANVDVAGYTSGAGLDSNTLTGNQDLIVTQYNSSGTRQWTTEDGTSGGTIYGNGAAIDSSGNIYVVGNSANTGLDGNSIKGIQDLIITKYNSAGTRQWTDEDGAAGASITGFGVAVDSASNVYATGTTSGAAFDGHTLMGTEDMFIMKISDGTDLLTLTFPSVNGTAFTAQATFVGDLNSNNSATIYYCDSTASPGCNPMTGTSGTMTRANTTFTYAATGLTMGHTISVDVVATDSDGIYGSPLTGSVTLLSDCRFILTSGTTWTVPSDWTSTNNKIEVIGAGGGGGSGKGGGGGGYSAKTNVTLTAGSSVGYSVGAAGVYASGGATYFCNSTSNCASISGTAVLAGANGGTKATTTTAGAGGSTTGAVGSLTYAGGNGGVSRPFPLAYGGGGGAGGPSGAGGAASYNTGGTADGTTVAGNSSGTEWGTAGCGGGGAGALSAPAINGLNYGGGGGGSSGSGISAGGAGLIVITYAGTTCQ